MANGKNHQDTPGLAVDNKGNAVVDPTANVISLVEAAMLRQDDLRDVERAHVRELITLRADQYKELRVAEKERIDAIRKVDVDAVATASAAADARANTLAKQVADSAETLRNQVAATAAAGDLALKAALDPIIKDIAELRKVQYETAGGKAQGVETREVIRDTSGSRGMWIGLAISGIFGLIGLVIGIVTLITRLR